VSGPRRVHRRSRPVGAGRNGTARAAAGLPSCPNGRSRAGLFAESFAGRFWEEIGSTVTRVDRGGDFWLNATSALHTSRFTRDVVGAVLFCAVLLGGCALPRSTRPVLKIGLIAPFEGLGRPLGYQVLYGVKLAVRERNDMGGVGGYGVALVALNDDDDADHAARQAMKMDVDSDVVGVIGPLSRSTARAVAQPLADADLAWIAPASVPDEVVAAYQNALRLYASDASLAEDALGRVMAADPSGEGEVVAVGSAGEFGEPLRHAAERLHVYQSLEAMSVRPSSPVALGGDAEQVAEELIRLGGTLGMVVAGPEAGRAVVTQRAAGTAEGLIWVGSLRSADPTTLPEAFVSGYQELAGGPPGPYAVLAYDATNLLLDAIELDITQHGSPSRQGVIAALLAVRAEGLRGELRFDAKGSWLDAPVYAYRVAGDDVFAEPLRPASPE